MAHDYRERRELLCAALREAGFKFSVPEGAYYVLADFSDLSQSNDREFALWLAKDAGIATVPGTSFHATPGSGRTYVRFAFCKKKETLERAVERILSIRSLV
jgi:aminotransferase